MKEQIPLFPLIRHRVSQREIAKRAGVSTSTVSRVLNHVDGISDELREHVLTVAAQLGYHNGAVPGKLVQLHLLTIPFAERTALHTFHSSILDGVAAECRRNGILLSYTVVEQSDTDHMALLSRAWRQPGSGIFLMSMDDRVLIEQFLTLNMPVALINAEQRDLPVDSFLPDNFISGLLATRYLVTHGHRRILHMNEPVSKRRGTLQQRFNGYQAALQEADLPYDPALVLESPLRVDDAYQTMRAWLSNHQVTFSAIFCANDASAIGVMRALQETGRQIPAEISIIGHDDVPAASLLIPALTTVHIDCEEMGRLAVQRMMYRALKPETAPIRVEIASKLVIRQSVARHDLA